MQTTCIGGLPQVSLVLLTVFLPAANAFCSTAIRRAHGIFNDIRTGNCPLLLRTDSSVLRESSSEKLSTGRPQQWLLCASRTGASFVCVINLQVSLIASMVRQGLDIGTSKFWSTICSMILSAQ